MERTAVAEPMVSEIVGGPEAWADGGIVRLGLEVVTVIYYRDEAAGQRTEVLRVRMPYGGFARSLLAAWSGWLNRRGVH